MLRKLYSENFKNRGFSLVELIVVVLIIAIIAAALVPQVVKYVSKARVTTDEYQMAEIKSCAVAAVAECEAKFNVDPAAYRWYDSEGIVTQYSETTGGETEINVYLGRLIQENIGKDLGKHALGHDYLIAIGEDGAVTVTQMAVEQRKVAG